jgi:UDP-N-acetylglucosamine/UDP-N-acetylgalactosamine diphosphorylase
MLNQPPIFLGGQGGAVGPVCVAFGAVVAAGSILRHDVPEGGRLVVAGTPAGFQRDRGPHGYRDLAGVVRNNLAYLANLVALEQWYRVARKPFFARQELGELVFEGALEVLALAKKERVERLAAMAERVPVSSAGGRELRERLDEIEAVFEAGASLPGGGECAAALAAAASGGSQGYIQAVQGLTPGSRNAGVDWLQEIVDALCRRAGMLLPSLGLFDGAQ